MLTIGLAVLLTALVWEFVRLVRAGRHPTASFVLVYAAGVVLLIMGSIFARASSHPGLSLSSFVASGFCLASLWRQDVVPPGGGLAS
jgi:hypothetical protein